ncbi:MAG TPA: 5-oxoprolinase subunit PxpA [Salegentibacter sp.]|nr:5-oxoprolinase subunit PxpA [Salegentibacter sp.]
MKEIHINCDLGEGGDFDADLMPLISACNIACGGHAGTLETMHETVALALENQVKIGAHPSYPDKENFGRQSLEIPAGDLQLSLVAQILSLKQIAEAEGAKLSHIKPHGALYNDAAKDEKIAQILIDSVLEFDEILPLFMPQNSVISEMAEGKIPLIFEAFADRNYNENYSLVSRTKPNALITEKEAVFEHLFAMFSEGKIRCENGIEICCKANTFCLHSDTPNSVEILKYLHDKLAEKNIKIKST